MSKYDLVVKKLEELYPLSAQAVSLPERFSPLLISDQKLELPQAVLQQGCAAVSGFFELRSSAGFEATVLDQATSGAGSGGATASDFACAQTTVANFSALMSYDFHVDPTGSLKLIEINTNASSSLLFDLIYRVDASTTESLGAAALPSAESFVGKSVASGFLSDFRSEIVSTFRTEFEVWNGLGARELRTIAIIDEKPKAQKLYLEFELYKELFAQNGLACVIGDPAEFSLHSTQLVHTATGAIIDLVYNRHTDFYFAKPDLAHLCEAFTQQYACFSPNPHEYALLADKQRLLDLSKPGALASFGLSASSRTAIEGILLKTFDVTDFTPDDLWAQRKKFFFKPKRSHGGKAVYKGASIAKTAFQAMLGGETIVQEFAPPAMFTAQLPDGSEVALKYDLRFYVYRDVVQMVGARLYQGQTTNAHTVGGGLTAVKFV